MTKVSQRNLLNVVLVVSGYNYCCHKEAQLKKITSNSIFNFILLFFSYRFNTLQKPQEGFIILRWRENIKHTNLMNDLIYFKILCALLYYEADVHLSSCLSILSNLTAVFKFIFNAPRLLCLSLSSFVILSSLSRVLMILNSSCVHTLFDEQQLLFFLMQVAKYLTYWQQPSAMLHYCK